LYNGNNFIWLNLYWLNDVMDFVIACIPLSDDSDIFIFCFVIFIIEINNL
jgi:hypothetical protein